MSEKLSGPLQESILTLLATNDQEGAIASGLIDHKVFDANYQDIVQRVLIFRKRHGKAPGKAHLDDIVDDISGNVKHKQHRQMLRILDGVLSQADSLNAKYVLSRIHEFSKRQRLKSAILEAGDIYQAGRDSLVEEVEGVLQKALKPDATNLDTGMFLGSKSSLGFLNSMRATYLTGIPELDRVNIGPTQGELLMFMAPKGAGKSWWAIDLGRRCLMQQARVVHISLEMSEERVAQRYYQNFFALGKRKERFMITEFDLDNLDRISGFTRKKRKVHMSLDSPRIERYLFRKQRSWGTRLNRLVIKSFPTKSLTISKLNAYLDMLELQHGFIPTVLIVDYPDLMWMDKKDQRISIGANTQELRGLMQARSLAGIAPTQTNRKGWDAAQVKGSMVAEDASKFQTADQIIIYSASKMEKDLGLARLYVEKNRNDEDGFSVVISQSYKTGQFVLSSGRMYNNYNEILGNEAGEDEED